ncbi:MAG: glycosyltransferase [Lentisphaeraceae bacterium]|nr:glycosyltransferase [Lentisphaeraceae bacterium]
MSRLKVLQVSHSYAAPFGDVANFYATAFSKDKYEVTSLFLKGKPTDNPNIDFLGDNILFWNLKTKEMRGLKLSLISRLAKLINTEKYDIIIAQRYKAIYLVGMAGYRTPPFKFFGVIHAYNVFKNFSRKLFIKLLAKKISLIGVSKAIKTDISSQLSSINFHKVHAIHNCIPIKQLQDKMLPRNEARAHLDIPIDAYVFGTAGRLHPEKDHETLILAFNKFSEKKSNVCLYIMGDGRLKNKLQILIDTLNLTSKVFLLGKVPEGPKYFKAFDSFVLPSAIEPFGMVLIEAMAANIPVISSRSGGAIEILKDQKLIFDIGDIDGCNNSLNLLLSSSKEDIQKIIFNQAKDLKENFSQRTFNSKLMDIIK